MHGAQSAYGPGVIASHAARICQDSLAWVAQGFPKLDSAFTYLHRRELATRVRTSGAKDCSASDTKSCHPCPDRKPFFLSQLHTMSTTTTGLFPIKPGLHRWQSHHHVAHHFRSEYLIKVTTDLEPGSFVVRWRGACCTNALRNFLRFTAGRAVNPWVYLPGTLKRRCSSRE